MRFSGLVWIALLVASCAHAESPATAGGPTKPRVDPRSEWKCPYPEEAVLEHVARGSALLEIQVDATGKAESITLVEESGHGFGRQARECLSRSPFVPARDATGNAIAGTFLLRVTFDAELP